MIWPLLYFAAGACLFLWLMNRYFIDMTPGWHKLPAIAVLMVVTLLLPPVAGWLLEGTYRALFPAVVLTGTAFGEAHRHYILRRDRGQAPQAVHRRVARKRLVTTTDLAVAHYAVRVPAWQGERLRIAHVGDLHVNKHLPIDFYRDALQEACARNPDLLLFTGDFISHKEDLDRLKAILPAAADVERRFATLGNHDYWTDTKGIIAAAHEAGFDVLNGEARTLALGGGRIVIAGCDLPWGDARWSPPPSEPGDLVVVLSHSPDNVYLLQRCGAHVVLSGHLHAGQFKVPWLGALGAPSRYGRRYVHGHYEVKGTHLFVTAGIGANEPPVRVNCLPDLFIVDIAGSG